MEEFILYSVIFNAEANNEASCSFLNIEVSVALEFKNAFQILKFTFLPNMKHFFQITLCFAAVGLETPTCTATVWRLGNLTAVLTCSQTVKKAGETHLRGFYRTGKAGLCSRLVCFQQTNRGDPNVLVWPSCTHKALSLQVMSTFSVQKTEISCFIWYTLDFF